MVIKFNKIIHLANDHAALDLKEQIKNYLNVNKIVFHDHGTNSEVSCDYPDYAQDLCVSLADNIGILVCGSGIGMAIAANRFCNIRAALCHSIEYAELARRHNNANVLVLGARFLDKNTAIAIIDKFLHTEFEGGRHEIRVNKLSNLGGKI